MVNKKGLTLDLNQTLLNLFFLFSLLYLNLGSWFLVLKKDTSFPQSSYLQSFSLIPLY